MVQILRSLSLRTLSRRAKGPARGLLLLCGLGTVAATPGARGDVSSTAHHSYRPRDIYKAPPPNLVLKQVVVIVRHGDRAPIARNVGTIISSDEEDRKFWASTLPSSDMIESWKKAYPTTPGLVPLDADAHPYAQLTTKGSLELRALGVHLKQRYQGHLLPESFEPTTLYGRATNIRRTQQSLQNFLLGLYPDGELVIEVRETSKETLYPNPDRRCGRQEELISGMRANAYNLPEPARSWYKQLIDESTRRVGLRSYVPWNVVREVLTCREVHGRPFPPSIDETYYRDIIRFCGLLWGQWYRNPEMLRLGMGRFLGEMMEHMKAGLDGSSPYKMVVFSGHDSTIVPILCALGVYGDEWPPYASNLVLEVAVDKHTGRGYVRAHYNDEEMVLPVAARPHGAWLRFEDLDGLLRRYIPVDYEKECECRDLASALKTDSVGDTIAEKRR